MLTSKKFVFRALIGLLILLSLLLIYLLTGNKRPATAHDTLPATAVNQVQTPLPVESQLHGCDISHWDGTLDWAALKRAKIEFVFVKATQGSTYTDPDFEINWSTAENYGLYRGAYHFYQPAEDPKAQAVHFLSVVKPQKGDLLPVLDIEISGKQSVEELTAGVNIWIETVKEAIGRYPIIYTDKPFWDRALNKDFGHCPLWIAEWEQGRPPLLPKGWTQWVFWQYSAKGTLAGIPEASGKTDLDRFYGNVQSIKNYQLK